MKEKLASYPGSICPPRAWVRGLGELHINSLKLTFGMKVVRNFGMSVGMQWYSVHEGCTVVRSSESGTSRSKFLCVGSSPASVSIAVELSTKPFGIEAPSFNALPIS